MLTDRLRRSSDVETTLAAALEELADAQSSDGDSDCEVGRRDSQSLLQDPCYRCQKRVYPVERVDVGVLFHRRCFRCRVCGLQLNLRTFHWDQENDPDVYCSVHVPKLVATVDKESMGIRSALNAPRAAVNHGDQTRGSVYNPGWQYDANALEFAHARELVSFRKQRTCTGTYEDFERTGVFAAQTELEQRQKVEEDKLYDTIREERERKVRRLEEELHQEKERSVREMVSTLERFSSQKTGITRETERLEEHYKRKKEEKVRKLMERILAEEKARVSELIQKQSREMLLLIAERLMAIENGKTSPESGDRSPTLDLSRPPPVSPPEFRRSQLFKQLGELEKIDSHVINVTMATYHTFTGLVKNLIVDCETDLEKARAIFRWITLTDLNQLEVEESVSPESPLALLRGIKYGTESYHDLFKRLCSYAGLHCEVIQGYSKGAGYRPGMKMEGDRFRNSWTAVSLDGSWYFVNCNWGARHVRGQGLGQSLVQSHDQNRLSDQSGLTEDGDGSLSGGAGGGGTAGNNGLGGAEQFNYQCDEFYFITDPDDHIYQHFPDDPAWQLLECPITLGEFINLPVVKSPFFNYGLKFATHYDCKQRTQNGLVTLQLKIPSLLGFGYVLEPRDRRLAPAMLEGRVMLRIIGHKAIFTVAPPRHGRYFFTIYAKDDWNSESLQSACAFQIKCRERREQIKSPYPHVSFFGPTPSMSGYGLIPQTHIDPVVTASFDDLEFQFQVHKDVRLSQSLHYHSDAPQSRETDFQRYIFIKHREENSIKYLVRCPFPGKYVFAIFGSRVASPDSGDGGPLPGNSGLLPWECLFRYLLECRHGSRDKRPLPRACHRWFHSKLLEPLVGDLETDKRVSFRVRTPMASDVALLIGDAWFHFRELADSIWEGSVLTSKRPACAKLYARLSKEKARFSPLLEFQVKANSNAISSNHE